MSELFPLSAATWREDESTEPLVPPLLLERRGGGIFHRVRDYQARHALRKTLSLENYRALRSPKHGLPVSENAAVYRFVGRLAGRNRTLACFLVFANALASLMGLVVPFLLGRLIDTANRDPQLLVSRLYHLIALCAIFVVSQAVFAFFSRWSSMMFGNNILASARESIVRTILQLPVSRIESSSTGDLVTRVTRDANSMANSVRWALPNCVIAVFTIVFILVAMVLNSWFLALPTLVTLALLLMARHHYIQHAPKGYIWDSSAYARVNSSFAETIEGARTIEAFGLQTQRIAQTDENILLAAETERFTLSLRNQLFFGMNLALKTPLVLLVVLGGLGYSRGWVSLGQITAASLFLQQIQHPLSMLVRTLNQMQVGIASTTRLLGISEVPPDRTPTAAEPTDQHLEGNDLRFAYRDGRDVLHGIDLDLIPGERLAIVGPSGSGKSTLGRLLAGINAPRTGMVKLGGVNVMDLPLPHLRTEVALVTQEHHVFVGSVRDNIILARENTTSDEILWQALRVVKADEWVSHLPHRLDTFIGSGNHPLTPAQTQQIALARLVVADPHTLVLDEATSLIDPHTARTVEDAMSSLLSGRTVVAIAHRLHTAYDADRIAVVIDGRIVEFGTHEELLDAGGEYAALWQAWTT